MFARLALSRVAVSLRYELSKSKTSPFSCLFLAMSSVAHSSGEQIYKRVGKGENILSLNMFTHPAWTLLHGV